MLMFVGVGLLSTYLQIYLQLAWAKFFFCIIPAARRMKLLVQRNIRNNRSKNSQIFLLLNLVMVFIIFSDSSFHSQLGAVYKLLLIRTGTDIRLSSSDYHQSLKTERLTEEILKFNRKYAVDEPPVLGFSFNCKAFKVNPIVRHITFSNHINFPVLKRVNLKCLDENYADTIKAEYYQPGTFVEGQATGVFKDTGEKHGIASLFDSLLIEKDKFDKNDLIFGDVPYIENYFGYGTERLLQQSQSDSSPTGDPEPSSDNSSQDDQTKDPLNDEAEENIKTSFFSELREEINVIMPEGLMSILAMSPGDTGILSITTETGLLYQFYLKISHTARTLPGTSFSSYSSRSRFTHDVFISKENYQFIFNMIMNPRYYNFSEDYRVRVTPLKRDSEDKILEDSKLTEQELLERRNWVVDPLKLEQDPKTIMYTGKSQEDIVKLINTTINSRIKVFGFLISEKH